MARSKNPKYKTDLFLYAALNRPAIVYLARNVKNGNCYVGVTRTTLDARKNKHLGDAKRGTRGRFYNAIRKHGEENFEWSVITECPSYYEALAEEVSQIASRKPAYNVTRGGEGALGYRHTKEELRRMSERRRGQPGHWLGKKRPPETVEKMRAAKLANPQRHWLGKKRDQATIDKIKASKVGCKAPPISPLMQKTRIDNCLRAAAARCKKVICLDDGRVFDSARAASAAYGYHPTSVANVCKPNSRCRAIYGRRFAYLQEDAS